VDEVGHLMAGNELHMDRGRGIIILKGGNLRDYHT
jgi:hypothetical protein